MQIAVIAGGLGTRLGALTAQTPKSMVPIGSRPFLQYQLELLRANGIRRVLLCIGHYGQHIVDYFGDGAAMGIEIRYSHEGERRLGTGGALKAAADGLEDPFMVMWGDSYLRVDYRAVWDFFHTAGTQGCMVVYRNRGEGDTSNVILRGQNVAAYDKWTPTADMEYIDYGLSVFRKEVLGRIPPGTLYALEQVFQELAAEGQLAAYVADQPFFEIGSVDGLAAFRAFAETLTTTDGEVPHSS